MKKVLYVATVKRHILSFHVPFLRLLKQLGYETFVAAHNDFNDKNIPFCGQYYDLPFKRNPFSLSNLQAYKQLRKIIKDNKFDIIHCHTPVGGVLARLAAYKERKLGTKVIYTAHGFHFFKGAPLINWLIYFPIEWTCSWFTDILITINTEDYEFARKHMHAKKIVYVPGVGIDLTKFKTKELSDAEKQEKRNILGLQYADKMILSVGELNENKNHEVVIKALSKLNDKNIKYFIAGKGPLKDYLVDRAHKLGIKDQVHLLGFRDDVDNLLQIADLFVFPSHREGLSVALMEAMSCKVPVICSDIRGNRDLIGVSALFNQNDEMDVADKIMKFLLGDCKEEVNTNYEMIQKYKLESVIQKMENFYK